MKKSICLLVCLISFHSHAKLLHIIHTNDLHSYFKGYVDQRGGYARITAKIEELKQASKNKNIPTLVLDGGDFGDGTSFFLANEGVNSLKALEIMQTEISVVGNHDFIMGGKALANQIRNAKVSTKIVSANLVGTPDMGLDGLVKPYADIEKGGLNIRVIGLTTAEPQYQYSMSPGFLTEPVIVGNIEAAKAKTEGKDLVIALTHIGTFFDKLLVKSSTDIDLVVGGHDHVRMENALMVKNRNNKIVPIVQAASHGLVVGSLIIDVKDNHQVEVVEYKLIDIVAPMEEDSHMAEFVHETETDRNQLFGNRFDEPIGFSEVKLTGYENGNPVLQKSCWGQNMAKMSADSTGSDIGVHLSFFEGVTINPGEITFGNIVDNFPHVTTHGDPGWELSTFEMNGKSLKLLLRAVLALKSQVGTSFYGVTFKSIGLNNIPYVGDINYSFNFRVGGKKINNKKKYTLAIPGEIAHAVKVLLPKKVQKIFPALTMSKKYYWQEMENYIKTNSPIRCL